MNNLNNKIKTNIFLISNDKMSFTDERHLINFSKYLFSDSLKHQVNTDTMLNTYYLNKNFNNPIKVNPLSTDFFVKSVKNSKDKISSLSMDLNYVLFIIELGDYVISNLFETDDDGNSTICIPDELISYILETYFDSDKRRFLNLLDSAVAEDKTFVNFEKIQKDDEVRLLIDKLIHKHLDKEIPTLETLISISHQDQESIYHIHRIIK